MKFTLLNTCIFILLHLPCSATYYSQCGQDKFVHENYFYGLKDGVFVDIGAHNGINISNTYFFESQLQWKGICVEPIPEVFAQLKKNRNCICIDGCITDRSGKGQLLKISTPYLWTEMLSGLLDKYDPRHVERILAEVKITGATYESNFSKTHGIRQFDTFASLRYQTALCHEF